MSRFVYWLNAFAFYRFAALFRKVRDDGWQDVKASLLLSILYFYLMCGLLGLVELGVGLRLNGQIAFPALGIVAAIILVANVIAAGKTLSGFDSVYQRFSRVQRFVGNAVLVLVAIAVAVGCFIVIGATKQLPHWTSW